MPVRGKVRDFYQKGEYLDCNPHLPYTTTRCVFINAIQSPGHRTILFLFRPILPVPAYDTHIHPSL